MTQRLITAVGLVAAALLLAVLVGIVGVLYARPVTAQQGSAGVGGMRQVTVVGRGTMTAKPNQATVQIGVQSQGATAQDALAQNSAQMQAIIEKLKELGIAAKDTRTSGFTISPTYDTDGRKVTGYQVSNMVSVTIRNLDQAGTLLDQVVQAGANSIYGVSFSVDDPKALLDQARTAAIADAKARAEKLATASGATVGEVLVITENVGSASPIPMPMAAQADAAKSVAVPMQQGEQSFDADVQVTFALR